MFDTTPTLDCAGRPLKLDRPRVCGILNLTDDSFSGDGVRDDVKAAVELVAVPVGDVERRIGQNVISA